MANLGTLILGNTAEKRDAKRHNWTFYVRGATEHVKSVTIKLHPTFKQPIRHADRPPFEFYSAGWGTFDIDVTVRWAIGGEFETSWELQFDHPDASTVVPIPAEVLSAAAGAGAAPAKTCAGNCALPGAIGPEPTAALDAAFVTSVPDYAGEMDVEEDEAEEDEEEEKEAGAEGGVLAHLQPASLVQKIVPEAVPLPGRKAAAASSTSRRDEITARLRSKPFLKPSDTLFKFGRGYEGTPTEPSVLWKSSQPPRKDHSCPKWLTATEYQDETGVMLCKARQLAELMRLSKKTVAYTGAGISAAVVGQAALSGQNKVGWKADTRSAQPTFTHFALGFLGTEGLLHGWVQQNHDGLPQRAGFPQSLINEIHGSWFDPSNPVVKYSGSLHDRSYPWMRSDADLADLVIVLGTSLGGLNADQVATKCADRSLLPPDPELGVIAPGAWVRAKPPGKAAVYRGLVTKVKDDSIDVRFADVDSDDDSEEDSDGLGDVVTLSRKQPIELTNSGSGSLGTVCINLQQTPQDGKMTLRLFGKSDDVLKLLLKELGYAPQVAKAPQWPSVHRVLVPYDKDGRRLPKDTSQPMMWLDLNPGQAIRITPGHNIQGARQPVYMHIGASQPYTHKGETRRPAPGHGKVKQYSSESTSFVLSIEGVQMRLGVWWLVSAIKGDVEVLPIVNLQPEFHR
mmetsp:Transcript_66102/g.138068  ORF Transcript_66102/g.138068 Transcript_66102/m.138068 type:complete len:681 (+) Transcript_66102:166-2208(+)|eukprot:CAMPEP_0206455828 /NCGR_PEP_ID=MMETSP0324_2-20121206/22007_1 /ASSEMBLY_ACC=CAM_ASM_000836 /TAXON_ID=2866 /ORGANISM="Crypthecodinium cohnii, Strain Seligo" /LENGTH=680 /DNA_ID=CAMNT_0053926651 /DNA_START=117 /DNA_END=2159 /DNA_ORIENTATION=+